MLTILERAPLPIDMVLARKYFRIYDTEHDSVIQLLLDAALIDLERQTRQTFVKTRFQWTGKLELINRFLLPRFPLLELVEVYSLSHGVAINLSEISIDDERTPPQLSGVLPSQLRITWDAGYSVVPADIKLLLLERAYEAFEKPGSSGNEKFKPQHALMLQGYCSQHDAVK